jgi:hypothetical protein
LAKKLEINPQSILRANSSMNNVQYQAVTPQQRVALPRPLVSIYQSLYHPSFYQYDAKGVSKDVILASIYPPINHDYSKTSTRVK